MKLKKYSFRLSPIDVDLVLEKYGLSNSSNSLTTNSECNTRVQDLMKKEDRPIQQPKIKYHDETWKSKTGIVVGIQAHIKNCFWCRYAIEGVPVSIPIHHLPKIVDKTCTTPTNHKFVIKEEVVSLDTENMYRTDGAFCSFNCALAFVRDNTHNPFYAKSERLLKHCFLETFGDSVFVAAPHWRLLEDYGGCMDIVEFRNSFGTVFSEGVPYNNYPDTKVIGMIYEELIRL